MGWMGWDGMGDEGDVGMFLMNLCGSLIDTKIDTVQNLSALRKETYVCMYVCMYVACGVIVNEFSFL